MQSHSLRNITTIFEKQSRSPQKRMCGPATLAMAYRVMGLELDQNEIATEISQSDGKRHRTQTRSIAAHAIQTGLNALVIQTHRPWQALRSCWSNGLTVILNHRLQANSSEGHYSLLAGLNSHSIQLNDPLTGPQSEIEKEAFLALWLPQGSPCEISGYVMVVLGNPEFEPDLFSHCNLCLPESIRCQQCATAIYLRPALALGCLSSNCDQRNWHRIFCHQCDFPIGHV